MLCLAVFLISANSVQAYFEWYIPEFEVNIQVLENGNLIVTEHIQADFDIKKHGIYRDIPVKYLNDLGLNYNLRLDVLSVADEQGTPWNYETSKSGQNIRIKIGDADVYVQDKQEYIIKYSVQRGIKFFDEFDELYWNATGNEWEVPIKKVSLTVEYPDESEVKTTCFTGYRYSRKKNCTQNSDENKAYFSTKNLAPHEGLTASIAFEKELLTPPPILKEVVWFVSDNWGFGLPFLAFLCLYYLWWTRGKDPKKHHTIVVEFSAPDDLTPAEMGTLTDESADLKDISAEIVHLAVNKYLVIEEVKKKGWIFSDTKFVLRKKKDKKPKKPLNKHQKLLMKALFGTKDTVKMSDLKNKFYKSIPGIKEALYNEVVNEKKYFPKNPQKVRIKYFVIGAMILFFSFFGFGFFAAFERFDLLFGTLLLGPVFMIMSRFMPRKTLKGSEAYRKTLGFQDYINTAERYRVKFQEDQNIFERFLPYAMIFGLADKWGEAFKDIYKGKPDWYKGEGDFVPSVFVGRLHNFTRSANSTLASRPSSKGSSGSSGFSGGFSGGGVGGGGGGSW